MGERGHADVDAASQCFRYLVRRIPNPSRDGLIDAAAAQLDGFIKGGDAKSIRACRRHDGRYFLDAMPISISLHHAHELRGRHLLLQQRDIVSDGIKVDSGSKHGSIVPLGPNAIASDS